MKAVLDKLANQTALNNDEAYETMLSIMNGELTPVQIAAFLMGLKIKGETTEEISAFVKAMLNKANIISAPAGTIDTCGTGGDGSSTFNISTASSIVTAAAGIPVAKHGNRSVSSKCGSADVFKALGMNIELSPEQAEKCLHETGLVFLFAPLFHPSMKHAVVPRREMGIRTVFNILGPMSNPAQVKRQVIGAFNLQTAEKMVNVLKSLGSEHIMVIHSQDGLDEFSISSDTDVFELVNGEIKQYTISPESVGISKQPIESVKGNEADENAQIIKSILDGEKGAKTDITALNAGAAMYVGGKSSSIKEGVELAFETIYSGKAKNKLNECIEFTQSLTVNAN